MTELQLAWAAGLFEGEGTVRINKPTLRNWGALCVSVVNTDIQIVEWFNAHWPGYFKPSGGLGPHQRPAWVWVIASRVACAFLQSIRPYVVRDKVRAKIDHAIYFQGQKSLSTGSLSQEAKEQYAEDQWNAYWWMCELNKRGTGLKNPKVRCEK